MIKVAFAFTVVGALAWWPAPAVRAQAIPGKAELCATDLLCVDLIATAAGGDARGIVQLGRAASPFGVAVTVDGHQRYDLTAWISGLAEPATLGDSRVYVAWATTPVLDPMIRLGTVTNGRNTLGEIALDKFLVLVTAEVDPQTPVRTGPLVLRGRSPSTLMQGHDMLAQAPAAVVGSHVHGSERWPMPPMYPGLTMLPGIMAITPRVAPLELSADSTASLSPARPGQVVRLGQGGTLDLEAGFVTRRIGDRDLVMLAFNRQHPGPLISVTESTTIFVNFTNRTPFPTAIHWHGVRLDNRFDGVPGVTQDPVEPNGTFRYQVFFRDAGIYWYHPHHREDVQQELGLYGNMLVASRRPDYLGPVHREEVLILDDLLVGGTGPVAFGDEHANYMLMGRFGNVFLVNGQPDYVLRARAGDVIRLYFTNASNTRTFNVSLEASEGSALPLKLVASDVSKFEREQWVESVVLAPAERYVVEARFPSAGTYRLVNRVQAIDHFAGAFFPEVGHLAEVRVSADRAARDLTRPFQTLRDNGDVIADIDRYRSQFDRPADYDLVMTLEVDSLPAAVEQVMSWDRVYFNPVEWVGTMPVMNWASTGREVRWILRDPRTGAENGDIDWRFRVGDVVKIRVLNDREGFHAMQHPLHIHGQRFLVLSQNSVRSENLVWKDTALLPTGSTTELLLELSNPGRWMVHCHIAEHLESGMKFVFTVEG